MKVLSREEKDRIMQWYAGVLLRGGLEYTEYPDGRIKKLILSHSFTIRETAEFAQYKLGLAGVKTFLREYDYGYKEGEKIYRVTVKNPLRTFVKFFKDYKDLFSPQQRLLYDKAVAYCKRRGYDAIVEMSEKECSLCKTVKPIQCFYKKDRRTTKGGSFTATLRRCKDCIFARRRKYREESKEKRALYSKEYRERRNADPVRKERYRRRRELQRRAAGVRLQGTVRGRRTNKAGILELKCAKCKRYKPTDEYSFDNYANKWFSYCKACRREDWHVYKKRKELARVSKKEK